MPTLVSINISKPKLVTYAGGRTLRSGILKKTVAGKIFLDTLGFQGDGVADRAHHGGEDMAVCGYCMDHFSFWKKELGRELQPGAFGENLSVTGLPETTIHIGDRFLIGSAEVECSQPRQPCHKLNKILDTPDMAFRIQQSGFSGYYFRVVKPGWVEPGCEMLRIREGAGKFPLDAVNRLMYLDTENRAQIRKILALESLSKNLKKMFRNRLDKIEAPSARKRAQGNR